MHDDLIKRLILKHFENFALGMEGKYHNVGYDDIRRLIDDVIREIPLLPVKLEIATRALTGILANPNASKGQRSTAQYCLSMADELVTAYLQSEAKNVRTT